MFATIIIIILLIVLFLLYMGVICPSPIIAIKVDKFLFVYKECQGKYTKIKDEWISLGSILKKLPEKDRFNLTPVGIYWDDPRNLIDESKSRWCIGVKIDDPSKKATIDILKNEGLKTIELPTCESFTTTLVFRNKLSYLFLGCSWGRFANASLWGRLKDKNDLTALQFCPKPYKPIDNRFHLHMMVGETRKEYKFSTLPKPKNR